MKKLLVILVLVGLGYITYQYLRSMNNETAKKQDLLKPGEKALKEEEKAEQK